MADTPNVTIINGYAHLLHRASQYTDELYAGSVGDADLTARQLVVLEIVSKQGKPSQTEICQLSGIDRSTIADMVGRLVKKGYLARRRTRTDARRYAVQLTDAGRKVLDSARPQARAVEEHIGSLLGTKGRQPFVTALNRIIQAASTRGSEK